MRETSALIGRWHPPTDRHLSRLLPTDPTVVHLPLSLSLSYLSPLRPSRRLSQVIRSRSVALLPPPTLHICVFFYPIPFLPLSPKRGKQSSTTGGRHRLAANELRHGVRCTPKPTVRWRLLPERMRPGAKGSTFRAAAAAAAGGDYDLHFLGR